MLDLYLFVPGYNPEDKYVILNPFLITALQDNKSWRLVLRGLSSKLCLALGYSTHGLPALPIVLKLYNVDPSVALSRAQYRFALP